MVIPFAERIHFPAATVQHRRAHEHFLGLIEASTLLHQHQRERVDGRVLAAEEDFRIAASLAEETLQSAESGLSRNAASLLSLLRREALTTCTLPELAGLLPQWTRAALRGALKELCTLDYLASPNGGRGRRARVYHVLGETGSDGAPLAGAWPGIRLLTEAEAEERRRASPFAVHAQTESRHAERA